MKIIKSNIKLNKKEKSFLSVIFLFIAIGIFSSIITFNEGLGSWNINSLIPWGLDITTFVFWIGIGHSGTLISAVLLLLRQDWRNDIAVFAEIMTIFSIFTAALIPIFHLGRFWLAYWIIPYPNQMNLWNNFKSPLMWDFLAIGIYLILSIIYFYLNLLPKFRDFYFTNKLNKPSLAFILSLGWIGTNQQWNLYNKLIRLFAGLITALVIAVHSIVSFDFSVTINPQWHLTIFPPYFVAGAIFSGCAMIILLMNLFSILFNQDKIYSELAADKISKIIVFMSWILIYSFLMELFAFMNSTNEIEKIIFESKFIGNFGFLNIFSLTVNLILPSFLIAENLRKNRSFLIIISLLILITMWLERYIIVLSPLRIDFVTKEIINYSPSIIEFGLLLGSIGLFLLLMFFSLKLFFQKNE